MLIAFFMSQTLLLFLPGALYLCCMVSATDLKELFSLLSGVFYLTLLSHICHSTASAMDLKRAFFTLRHFLPYTASRHLAQPVFIEASLRAGSSFLNGLAGPLTKVQNTDRPHLFV